MLFEYNSNIIQSNAPINLKNGTAAELLELHNGLALVLTEKTIAMFKNKKSVLDLLGNGLMASIELNTEQQLEVTDGRFVKQYMAGYITLIDDRGLLITPNDIQLFPDNQSALRNTNEIARLSLASNH